MSDKNLALLVMCFPLVIGFFLGGWYVHSNQEEIVPLAGDMYIFHYKGRPLYCKGRECDELRYIQVVPSKIIFFDEYREEAGFK